VRPAVERRGIDRHPGRHGLRSLPLAVCARCLLHQVAHLLLAACAGMMPHISAVEMVEKFHPQRQAIQMPACKPKARGAVPLNPKP
jgi:hypothetical protein